MKKENEVHFIKHRVDITLNI